MIQSASSLPKLYYIHDPMCSWCWAFNPVWQKLRDDLSGTVAIETVLGGLAPDNDNPMPAELQQTIQNIWRTIQVKVPGTQFNFDFWTQCKPRRSTYIACRAVIAAKSRRPELEAAMILAIQTAYYRNAQNPSDAPVLIGIAHSLGLDAERFAADLDSADSMQELTRQIALTKELGVPGFPSLVLESENGGFRRLTVDYNDPNTILQQVNGLEVPS